MLGLAFQDPFLRGRAYNLKGADTSDFWDLVRFSCSFRRVQGECGMSSVTKPSKNKANGTTLSEAIVRPVTVPDFLAAKAKGIRLTLLTVYDYTMARLLDA